MSRIYRLIGSYSILVLAIAAGIDAPARSSSSTLTSLQATFTTLLNFNDDNGSNPNSVIQGRDGNLYGTTYLGGANFAGEIFSSTTDGILQVLYSFLCSQSGCPDGDGPYAPVTLGRDGNIYGTTSLGGLNDNNCVTNICGTIFRLTPQNDFTVLYNFCSNYVNGNCLDGTSPGSALIQAADGNFYGTTGNGGINACPDGGLPIGCGTVFKITPDGAFSTVYSFCSQTSCTDGENPNQLMQASDGNLYGTTQGGGTNCPALGDCGTVFRLTLNGDLTTLYSFCSQSACADGDEPDGMVEGDDGNLYGVTTKGGSEHLGTIFELTHTGTLNTLHNFLGTDGAFPVGPLVLGTDGNFYGTAGSSGENHHGAGVIFSATPEGQTTVLHQFSNLERGQNPLFQSTDGSFYGTTTTGPGEMGYGTLYRLSTGLGPFVRANPGAGKMDATVGILGTDLTGTTSVSFNGISASFTVKSATFIVATVPSGAITGKIQVVTPNGTLSSNVPFIVLP